MKLETDLSLFTDTRENQQEPKDETRMFEQTLKAPSVAKSNGKPRPPTPPKGAPAKLAKPLTKANEALIPKVLPKSAFTNAELQLMEVRRIIPGFHDPTRGLIDRQHRSILVQNWNKNIARQLNVIRLGHKQSA